MLRLVHLLSTPFGGVKTMGLLSNHVSIMRITNPDPKSKRLLVQAGSRHYSSRATEKSCHTLTANRLFSHYHETSPILNVKQGMLRYPPLGVFLALLSISLLTNEDWRTPALKSNGLGTCADTKETTLERVPSTYSTHAQTQKAHFSLTL